VDWLRRAAEKYLIGLILAAPPLGFINNGGTAVSDKALQYLGAAG
jgi:hypothetical protein